MSHMRLFSIALIVALFGQSISAHATDAFGQLMKMRKGKSAFVWKDQQVTLDELAKLPDFRKQLLEWMPEQVVPKNTFSTKDLDQLASQMIDLTCQLKDKNVAIDAVGLSVLPRLNAQQPELFTKALDELNLELVGNKIPDKLPARLIALRDSITKVCKSTDDSKQVCLRVQLADRKSKLRNREEHWLLIEVDVTSRKYDHVLLNRVYDMQQRRDPVLYFDDIPQRVQPHPESEESIFEMSQPQPRQANRNTREEVVVKSDGLKKQEREARYRFTVIDNVQAEPMQIEGIAADIEGPIDLLHLLNERVAISKTYTLEELHLRCGDACAHSSSPPAGKSTVFVLQTNSEGYVEIRISTR